MGQTNSSEYPDPSELETRKETRKEEWLALWNPHGNYGYEQVEYVKYKGNLIKLSEYKRQREKYREKIKLEQLIRETDLIIKQHGDYPEINVLRREMRPGQVVFYNRKWVKVPDYRRLRAEYLLQNAVTLSYRAHVKKKPRRTSKSRTSKSRGYSIVTNGPLYR